MSRVVPNLTRRVVLVTVVIASYNRLPLLRQCLASVAAQTHEDWECLVCDDGSSDGTHEYVRELSGRDPRYRLSLGERFGLPAGPRNRGILEGRGPLVAFVDDDDLWHPLKLERQLRQFREHQVDAVATRLVMFDDGQQPAWETHDENSGSSELTLDGILRLQTPFPSTPTNVIRRDHVLRVRGFSEHAAYRALEDYDLWARLQSSPGFRWRVIGGTPLAAAREAGGDSISSWRRIPGPDLTRQRWAMLEILSRIVAADSGQLESAKRHLLARLTELADECAHRSRLLGWKRSSIGAYRIAARTERALGHHSAAAKRLARTFRFGLLGTATEKSPLPDAVPLLRARAERYVGAIIRGEALSDAPLPIDAEGAWSSLGPGTQTEAA
jgi:glycosyltransferase involved in cell wall biosynthesis